MTRQPRSVLRKSLRAVLLGLSGYCCKLIYTSILTHNMSLAHYGDFAVAWESLFLVSLALTFGSGVGAQRFVSRYVKEGKVEEKRCFINWLAYMFLQSMTMLITVYAVFWAAAYATKLTNSSLFDSYHLAAFVVIFAPALSLLSIAAGMILAFGYTTLATLTSTVVLRGGQLLAVLLFFSVTSIDGMTHLICLIFIIVLVPAITSITILLSVPNNEVIKSLTSKSSVRYQDKNWLPFTRAAFLNQIMFRLICTIDLFVLEIFSPEEDHVGIYSICRVIVTLLSNLMGTINQQTVIAIMNINEKKVAEKKALQSQLDVYNMIKLMILLVCMAVSTIFHVEIFAFFNVHNPKVYNFLPLMLVSVYLADNRYQFGYLMSKNDTVFMNSLLWAEVMLLTVLALILVFPYDIYGIILANIITRILYKVVVTYRCRQTTSLRLNLLF